MSNTHIIDMEPGTIVPQITGQVPVWKVAISARDEAMKRVFHRLAEAEMEDGFYLTPAQTALVVGIAMEAYDAGEGAL
mgnify:CR=1 FL=1